MALNLTELEYRMVVDTARVSGLSLQTYLRRRVFKGGEERPVKP